MGGCILCSLASWFWETKILENERQGKKSEPLVAATAAAAAAGDMLAKRRPCSFFSKCVHCLFKLHTSLCPQKHDVHHITPASLVRNLLLPQINVQTKTMSRLQCDKTRETSPLTNPNTHMSGLAEAGDSRARKKNATGGNQPSCCHGPTSVIYLLYCVFLTGLLAVRCNMYMWNLCYSFAYSVWTGVRAWVGADFPSGSNT